MGAETHSALYALGFVAVVALGLGVWVYLCVLWRRAREIEEARRRARDRYDELLGEVLEHLIADSPPPGGGS